MVRSYLGITTCTVRFKIQFFIWLLGVASISYVSEHVFYLYVSVEIYYIFTNTCYTLFVLFGTIFLVVFGTIFVCLVLFIYGGHLPGYDFQLDLKSA